MYISPHSEAIKPEEQHLNAQHAHTQFLLACAGYPNRSVWRARRPFVSVTKAPFLDERNFTVDFCDVKVFGLRDSTSVDQGIGYDSVKLFPRSVRCERFQKLFT
jgi:hypothetical protein